MTLNTILACALLAASSLANAGTLPDLQPDGLYKDDDPAAKYRPIPPGSRSQYRNRLYKDLRANPHHSALLAERAYLFEEGGDLEHARRDFDKAMQYADPGSLLERHVLWSRGWADYNQGDYAATWADWRKALAEHGGHPSWATYSFALLYWSAGDRDAALAWYDTAAQSDPRWATEAGMREQTRHWREGEQGRMEGLFAAWSSSKNVL